LQETTRQLEKKMAEGRAHVLRLRAGVTSLYGNRSEKLTEFGMRPLRRRSRARGVEAPEAGGTQVPPDPGSSR
jgi:hypothetical protein